jgi:phosphoribosylformylglycinamidine synthase II
MDLGEIKRNRAWRQMGLRDSEYEKIVEYLGREPNWTELGMFAVLWSEHCAYKHSRPLLGDLPTEGEQVLVGPGENAGVVDIGGEQAVAFRIESHNHPVFVEPYHGAATGVGGIIRDIISMGARPIALLDSLRFGDLEHERARWHLREGVKGIADYGNTVGVPTVGGEVYFGEPYGDNPLCNAMCVGLLPKKWLTKGMAAGVGNPVFLVGAATGRDGIHGATFASDELGDEGEPLNVQIGDPETERRLIEACLELVASEGIVGIQDMGAAGITSSCSETAARAGSGIEIDVAFVPRREEGMTPYEIMLSESQERMLVIAQAGSEKTVEEICARWDLHCAQIGRVTDDGYLRVLEDGEVVAEVPAKALTDWAPTYEPPAEKPAYLAETAAWQLDNLAEPSCYTETLKKLLDSPNIASKEWIYSQYDHQMRGNTRVGPGRDAAILQIPESGKYIAVAVDGNGRYTYLDPYQGGALSVAEGARNVACCGARPLGFTNCLNFGSPENPEVYWQFQQTINGLGDAARILGIPVTGGNVSLYNDTAGRAVYPTPVVGMVGLIDSADQIRPGGWQGAGDRIYLLGATQGQLGGSEYLAHIHGLVTGQPPQLNLEEEKALIELLLEGGDLLKSAHDLSEGGLAVALVESSLWGEMGIKIDLGQVDMRLDAYLFDESPSRVIVSVAPQRAAELEALADRKGVAYQALGETGGDEIVIEVAGQKIIELSLEEGAQVYREAIPARLKEEA